MECLIDYIGLQSCANDQVPDSGLYINTLPGISLESIDKIADGEQVTYKGVWLDTQKEAAVRFKIDFIEKLNACFTINRFCNYEDMICQNIDVLTNTWRYLLGNQLMLYRLYSSRLNKFTTVDRKQAEELKDYYQSEYLKSLEQAIKLIDVSSCCYTECGNNPERVVWLP